MYTSNVRANAFRVQLDDDGGGVVLCTRGQRALFIAS